MKEGTNKINILAAAISLVKQDVLSKSMTYNNQMSTWVYLPCHDMKTEQWSVADLPMLICGTWVVLWIRSQFQSDPLRTNTPLNLSDMNNPFVIQYHKCFFQLHFIQIPAFTQMPLSFVGSIYYVICMLYVYKPNSLQFFTKS